MGYNARGNGSIKFAKWNDEIEKILDETFEFDVFQSNADGTTDVCIWHPDDKYYGDYVIKTLNKVAPFTISGSIRFIGEDDEIWEIYYDPYEHTWNDDNVELMWPSDNLIDAEYLEIKDRKKRVEILLAKSLMKRFQDASTVTSCKETEINDVIMQYRNLIYGVIENEAWLQEYISHQYCGAPETKENHWILRQADVDRALMAAIMQFVCNHYE